MNLIEQAVDLMARARPSPAEPVASTPAHSNPPPSAPSLIERAMAPNAGEGRRRGAAVASTTQPPSPSSPSSTSSTPASPSRSLAPALQSEDRREVSKPAPQHATLLKAQIPLENLRARGFITPGASPTALSQEFRVIKRPLIDNAFGRNGLKASANSRRIMITSAYSGEGKSFCAINLAMSIAAERDTSVLLIDADVAKPSIPRELNLQDLGQTDIDALPGLMDCLLDPALEVDECVLTTNVERLALLPAGRRHEHATELLASASMGKLVERLSSRYDSEVLIFDSPPILLTTESRVLASQMGQIVMVVEAGRTSRESVVEALRAIGSPEHAGLILNKARESRGGSYGGYGYGYGTAQN
jgi:protein-tyrosine kinase